MRVCDQEAQSIDRESGVSPEQCCCRIAGRPAPIGQPDSKWTGCQPTVLQATGSVGDDTDRGHSGFLGQSVFDWRENMNMKKRFVSLILLMVLIGSPMMTSSASAAAWQGDLSLRVDQAMKDTGELLLKQVPEPVIGSWTTIADVDDWKSSTAR